MKINAFDSTFPFLVSLGQTTLDYSTGSNSAEGDLSGGGDVVGTPGDYTVVGLRDTVALASNIGGGAIGDVLTIVQVTPEKIAMFATSSNTGGASFGSNATRVSETSAVGASTNSAREDHIHDGIGTITASSSNTLQRGTVNLRPGTGIALALSDSDGSGVFDTVTLVNTAPDTGGGGGGGGGPTDYVSGASGTGQIIIPGLAGSPDIPPGGGSDDEFDTTDTSDPMTGWTTLGTPTAHDINSTAKSHYFVQQNATAGTSWVGIYKASPSMPFTVTAKLTDSIVRANYMGACLFVAAATPGNMMVIERAYNSGSSTNAGSLIVEKFTSPTAFSTAYAQLQAFAVKSIYLRMVVTSSTSIATYYSYDGLAWHTIETGRNPGFTVGAVGLAAKAENATHTQYAFFDWIRFS